MKKGEKKGGEVAVIEQSERALSPREQAAGSAELLIQQAIEKGLPVETMERLLAMRKDLIAERAKEAFDTAMAKFQAECPVIKKTKEGGKTKSGTVVYHFAPLDEIIKQTKELIGKHGFSYAIKVKTTPTDVTVDCIVKHEMGHSETSTMQVPLGQKTDVMSMPQVVASATTFATRYAFRNAFGIITGDTDNDAENMNKQPPKVTTPPATPAKAATIDVKPTAQVVPPAKPKLREDLNKAIHASWNDLATISGWNTEEATGKRKATLLKLYRVDSNNDLTEEQAKQFLDRIANAIKDRTNANAQNLAKEFGGKVVEKCPICKNDFEDDEQTTGNAAAIRTAGACNACLEK